MLTALVDTDNILFRAVTAPNVQKVRWQYKHKDGLIQLFDGLDKRGIVKLIQDTPAPYEGGELQKTRIITGTAQQAVYNVRDSLQRMCKKLGTDDLVLPLGDAGVPDFRRKLATLIPYKEKRKDQPIPFYFHEVREYLLKQWGAYVVKDIEVDDELATLQCAATTPTVICSVDKDFDGIPGDHFNYVTGERYITSDPGDIRLVDHVSKSGKKSKKIKGGGLLWFYTQMLLGDSADDIPNVARGYGPVKVVPLLQGVTAELEMFKVVYNCYKEDGNLGGDKLEEYLCELTDLLWIRRKVGQCKSNHIKEMLERIR